MTQLLPADFAALGSITSFQGLPPDILAWLLQAGELYQHAYSETVVLAGASADKLLAVVRAAPTSSCRAIPAPAPFRTEYGGD